MAKTEIILGDSGGSASLDELSVNGKTAFYTITTTGASWTADRDCLMTGNIIANGARATVSLNGKVAVSTDLVGSITKGVSTIGYDTGSESAPNTYGFFIPKDTTITTGASSSTSYNLRFFEVG